MDERDKQRLLDLFTIRRVATLAVMVDEAPFASLVPFATTPDFGAALIHASTLARHSAGLIAGAPFSFLIHEPDEQADHNPSQLGRVTLTGSVDPLDRDSEASASARDLYLAKFPKSAMTFQLGDFTLYSLQIETARFVAGFAKTFDLSQFELHDLAKG